MGYIALRPLKVGLQDGTQFEVQPGEPIPEIEHWGCYVIIAHLNLNKIQWVGEGTPRHLAHRENVVDIRAYQNAGRQSPVPTKGAGTSQSQRGATPGAGLPSVSENQCPHCAKQLGNKGALSNHIKAKHREEDAGKAG